MDSERDVGEVPMTTAASCCAPLADPFSSVQKFKRDKDFKTVFHRTNNDSDEHQLNAVRLADAFCSYVLIYSCTSGLQYASK